jgi:hypothetical protein
MEYEELLNICREVTRGDKPPKGDFDEEYWPIERRWNSTVPEKITDNPRLYVEWTTGGMSGGSCWGDVATGWTSHDPAPELEILDAVLEKVTPNLTFLQYRALTIELVKHHTHNIGEYYGNDTDYASKTVYIKELYEYLKEKNLI